MLRFSLRQVFPVTAVFGLGLMVAIRPQGDWIDLPFTLLNFFFFGSLLRHTTALRSDVAALPQATSETQWGWRILSIGLYALAATLLVAWIFRFLATAKAVQIPNDSVNLLLNKTQMLVLPRDLAVLAMLVASNIDSWSSRNVSKSALTNTVCRALGLFAAIVGMIVASAHQQLFPTVITFLTEHFGAGCHRCPTSESVPLAEVRPKRVGRALEFPSNFEPV